MERKEFMQHGLVRLPPGFRFHPTDEELVVQYLRRKAFSFPLPAAVIPEIDLMKLNPCDLPCGSGGEKYFFYLRERKSEQKKGRVSYQKTRLGYWKSLGKEKPVLASSHGNNQLVGLKQVMAFYRGKSPHGSKTDWIMNQYSLSNNELVKISSTQSLLASSKEWVVCQIFVKRRSMKLRLRNSRHEGNHEIPPTSSSSSSSCITEDLSDEESVHGEEEEAMSKIPSA